MYLKEYHSSGMWFITAAGAINTPLSFPVSMTILPAITIMYPNGGETLLSVQTVLATWDAATLVSQTVAKTDTYYSANNGSTWSLVKSQKGLKSTCSRRAPSLKSPSAACLVKTQCKNAQGAGIGEDVSDAMFTIAK